MPETIDNSNNQELKLNLKNLFTFLSSLDYIKAIEKSSAFRYIDSRQLFFIGEQQSLLMFVYTHTSFYIMFAYLFMLFSAYIILGIEPLYAVFLTSLGYLIFGIWFVNRYTWGDGYLWQVVKSFMINLTMSAFIVSIVMDLLFLYLIPFAYKEAINWLMEGNKEGPLNQIAYQGISALVKLISPLVKEYSPYIEKYLFIYIIASPLKVIAFAIPTALMFYLHRIRKNPRKRLNKILQKIA